MCWEQARDGKRGREGEGKGRSEISGIIGSEAPGAAAGWGEHLSVSPSSRAELVSESRPPQSWSELGGGCLGSSGLSCHLHPHLFVLQQLTAWKGIHGNENQAQEVPLGSGSTRNSQPPTLRSCGIVVLSWNSSVGSFCSISWGLWLLPLAAKAQRGV